MTTNAVQAFLDGTAKMIHAGFGAPVELLQTAVAGSFGALAEVWPLLALAGVTIAMYAGYWRLSA